jgi:hypothetical protein
VTCSADGFCTVLATSGGGWSAATADDGGNWQRGGTLPAGFDGANQLSCIDLLRCVTAGYVVTSPGHGSGAVAVSLNDGTAWTGATVASGTGVLRAASCAGTRCLAVGTTSTETDILADAPGALLASTDGGTTWATVQTAPAGMGDGAAVACPSAQLCAAVGTTWVGTPATPKGGVATSVDTGSVWATPLARYLADGLTGLSCPGTKWCVAVGGDVAAHITLPTVPAPKPKKHAH